MAKAMTNGAIPMSVAVARWRRSIYKSDRGCRAGEGRRLSSTAIPTSGHPGGLRGGSGDARYLSSKRTCSDWANALSKPFLDRFFDPQGLADCHEYARRRPLGSDRPGAGRRAGDTRLMLIADLYDKGVLVKVTGDTVMLSPAFICEERS